MCFVNVFNIALTSFVTSKKYEKVSLTGLCLQGVFFLHLSSWSVESEFPVHGLCLRWARACNSAAAIQEIFLVAPFRLFYFLALHDFLVMPNTCSLGTGYTFDGLVCTWLFVLFYDI